MVAIVRVTSAEEAVETCKAITKGGVRPVEVAMTTPGALEAITKLSSIAKDEAVIGAGTVLDPETARAAILAGAEFIVSPTLNLSVIEICHRYGKVVIPGAFSPTEILTAWEVGADIVKVFPAGGVGPQYIKDIRGPLPQIRLLPVGGVNLENTLAFIKAGAVAVGVGTSLVDKKAVSQRNYEAITEKAKKFLDAVRLARAAQA